MKEFKEAMLCLGIGFGIALFVIGFYYACQALPS